MDDCTEVVTVVKHGLCKLHYSRRAQTGEVGGAAKARIIGDDLARFWSYVDVRGPDDCHPWTGASTAGYGYFYAGGKVHRATRYLLEVIDGIDLEGLDACHRCDNPPCVNRRHLFPGTREANVADMIAKGRRVNGTAKATPDLVRSARLRHADGLTPAEVAQEFGMNYHTMYSILTRQTWKNVA